MQAVLGRTATAPPKAVADAIQEREKADIDYPADGKLMGDWKKGERLAQSRLRAALHRLSAAHSRTAATATPATRSPSRR